jgi:Zn-dependent protease/CBS domain-containing protein
MPATRTVTLAHLFGIRIGANPSWFIALLLMIVLLGGQFEVVLPNAGPAQAYGLSVLAALLFFVSLVAHELGHALMARRFGIQTEGIDLWLLGGVARLSRDSKNPKEEFFVAAAGPAVTLVVCLVGLGVGLLLTGSDEVADAVRLSNTTTTAAVAIVGWLTLVNGVLLVFNLIPAFPLDGGRIARSIAWKLTGDRRRATNVAGLLGRGFAILLGAAGVYFVLTDQLIDGLWFLILAWFIGGAARAAVMTSEVSAQLHEQTAGSLMDTQPAWLPDDATVLAAQHETFQPFAVPWAAMLDPTGRYLGIVMARDVQSELAAGRPQVPARDLLIATGAPRTSPDASLEQLLGSEALQTFGALPVVGEDDVMVGVVTRAQAHNALAAVLPGADGK